MDDQQPVSPVTLQMLNSLIDTQTRLRDAAEARWASARESLFGLARLVAADWLEEKQQQKGGLDVIRMEELSQIVYQRVSVLSSAANQPDIKQLQAVNARNDELNRKVSDLGVQAQQGEKLKLELETAQQEIENLRGENERLKAQTEKHKVDPITVSSNEPVFIAPTWYTDWAECKGFEKQSFALKFIGSTGVFLRQDILDAIAEQYNINFDSKSPRDALEALAYRGFIVFSEKETGERGRPPFAATMTLLGEAAFVFLTGELPRISNFDEIRPFHSTDEHTFLILKAVDILEAEGYEVISKGEINIPLDDNHISSPDILAQKNGQKIQIEVERDVKKGNRPARERKWENAYEAGHGKIYIFCETKRIQKQLVQEVNRALASESRLERASIYMTNIQDIEAGIRHKDGSIWIAQKRPAKPVI